MFTVAPLLLATLATTPSAEQLTRLEAWVRTEVERAGLPGAALAVVSGDRIVLSTSMGVTDVGTRDPVTPDCLFTIASMTKSVTATALFQLRDRGLLDLDAPVVRYIPWFLVADGVEVSRRITLRQLLHHTSGIPINSHGVVWRDPRSIRGSLALGVRALHSVRLKNPPGTHYEYANMNYAVLGLVVEVVSGQPWSDYVRTHILEPAGMTRSSVDRPRTGPAGGCQARPYAPSFGRLGPAPLTVGRFSAPASAMLSTAPDMARYAMAHLGTGAPLLSASTLVEAQTDGVDMGQPPPNDGRYAGGWISQTLHGTTVIHHGGAAGHSGAVYLIPEHKLAFVLLASGFSADRPLQISEGAVAILLGHEPTPTRGLGQLQKLLWVSRGVLGLTCTSLALLIPLAGALWWVRRRVGVERRPIRRALYRLMPPAATAGGVWLVGLVAVPFFAPELPLPFAFYGWPIDLGLAALVLLLCSHLWLTVSLLRLVRRDA